MLCLMVQYLAGPDAAPLSGLDCSAFIGPPHQRKPDRNESRPYRSAGLLLLLLSPMCTYSLPTSLVLPSRKMTKKWRRIAVWGKANLSFCRSSMIWVETTFSGNSLNTWAINSQIIASPAESEPAWLKPVCKLPFRERSLIISDFHGLNFVENIGFSEE